MRKGLIVVFTGEGKGKTSAALGIALRASGYKHYVSIVQFIKGNAQTGESRAVERLKPEVELITLGRGFVHTGNRGIPLEEHCAAARSALSVARQRVLSGSWDVVVLDEINTAMSLGLIDTDSVLELIAVKPPNLHLVLTGRNAPQAVIDAADLVTEMRNIKHPFDNGVAAQQGIDF